jgi:hypothetical protein
MPTGATSSVADGVVRAVVGKLNFDAAGETARNTLEHAVLDAWALSEAATSAVESA